MTPAVPPADLRRLRESAGLSQNALSKRLNMTSGAVSRIESGERGLLLDTLRAWAEACGHPLRIDFGLPAEVAPTAEEVLASSMLGGSDDLAETVRVVLASPAPHPRSRLLLLAAMLTEAARRAP